MTSLNFAFFGFVFRAMIRRCRIPCLRLCALGISRMRSNFVVMHTNHGAPRASADLLSSRGLRYVSSPFSPSPRIALTSGSTTLHCPLATARQYDTAEEGEEGDPDLWYGNKRRALWKTACTRAALDSRLSSTERAFIRRARAVRPDLNRTQVLMSYMGRRALGDDFCFMRRATERGTCAVGWGILGAVWERVGGGDVGEREGDGDEEEDAWRVDVEQELQTLATVQVQEGLGADNPFHISQLHIILDRTDALLDDFASRLRDGAYDSESSECVLPLPFRYDLVISLSTIPGIRR